MRKILAQLAVTIAIVLPAAAQQIAEIPDNVVTPGIVATTDEAEVCAIVDGLSYSKRHRATPAALKAMIRKRDGCDPLHSEVDHRCPLALGCADVVENLWCQPELGVTWSYHDKDRLEVLAWESVCRHHTLPLPAAQAMFIAPADWRVNYCVVFPEDPRCAQSGGREP